MIWLLAIPLIYSGFLLHSACVAPVEGLTITTVALDAFGKTLATVGALLVIV